MQTTCGNPHSTARTLRYEDLHSSRPAFGFMHRIANRNCLREFHLRMRLATGDLMSASSIPYGFDQPHTAAVRRALGVLRDRASMADLLFLERWEMAPVAGAAAALRVAQIRRANPELAAAVRAEVARVRA